MRLLLDSASIGFCHSDIGRRIARTGYREPAIRAPFVARTRQVAVRDLNHSGRARGSPCQIDSNSGSLGTELKLSMVCDLGGRANCHLGQARQGPKLKV